MKTRLHFSNPLLLITPKKIPSRGSTIIERMAIPPIGPLGSAPKYKSLNKMMKMPAHTNNHIL